MEKQNDLPRFSDISLKYFSMRACSLACSADSAGGGLGMSMTLVPNLVAADEQRQRVDCRVNGCAAAVWPWRNGFDRSQRPALAGLLNEIYKLPAISETNNLGQASSFPTSWSFYRQVLNCFWVGESAGHYNIQPT